MMALILIILRVSLLLSSVTLFDWSNKVTDDNKSHELVNKCVSTIRTNNDTLTAMIRSYTKMISNSELPIIIIQVKKDTTFYYITALMSTNAIRRNTPTCITTDFGRESLLYDYGRSKIRISKTCQQYLVDKYKLILHADKIKVKEGLPHNAPDDFTYDPVLAKISVVEDKATINQSRVDSVPYFRYR